MMEQIFGLKTNKKIIQPNLHINSPDDKYEQEADAMASRVMRMEDNVSNFIPKTGIIGNSIQRKCAACEEEEKRKPIMRKESSGIGGMPVSNSFSSSLNTTKGNGDALPTNTRNFMENAFSSDFSNVKIHNDCKANALSQNINAKAFTHGSDIYFGAGQYSPNSYSGKSLLAHELTHVVQQGGNNTIRRESVREDLAGNPTTTKNALGNTIYSGSVERSEYRNETDKNSHKNAIYQSNIGLKFNETTCQLIIPISFQFINQDSSHLTSCGNITGNKKDPVKPVSNEKMDKVKSKVISEVANNINGWYNIALEGKSCSPCRNIPIVVEFTEATSAADSTIIVTGNEGRSYVQGSNIALCGSDANDLNILIHEAGHFALKSGDEYHEDEAKRPEERERPGQYSRLAQDAPQRLLEFHDRHFNFAIPFMKSIYPACNPKLNKQRLGAIEYTPYVGIGIVGIEEFDVSLGLQLGIPLTSMRRLSLLIGPKFSYLALNKSFMGGITAGIEARAPLGFFGNLGFRGFGSLGLMYNTKDTYFGKYLEAGVGIDLRIHNSLNNDVIIGLEAAKTKFDIDKDKVIEGYRYGLRIGVSF